MCNFILYVSVNMTNRNRDFDFGNVENVMIERMMYVQKSEVHTQLRCERTLNAPCYMRSQRLAYTILPPFVAFKLFNDTSVGAYCKTKQELHIRVLEYKTSFVFQNIASC